MSDDQVIVIEGWTVTLRRETEDSALAYTWEADGRTWPDGVKAPPFFGQVFMRGHEWVASTPGWSMTAGPSRYSAIQAILVAVDHLSGHMPAEESEDVEVPEFEG